MQSDPEISGPRNKRVKYRIDFKINILIYKSLHTNQPVYPRELLSLSKKQRTRASGNREVIRPRFPKPKAGSRAPYLWNSLPAEVRIAETYSIFRKKLKTHFFASCFFKFINGCNLLLDYQN